MRGKERVELNYTDNSIGKISNNTFSGYVENITAGIGNTTIVNKNSPGGSNTQQISDAEWVELAKFFLERQLSSDIDDQKFAEQYARAEELVKKTDRKGLKDFFKNAGSSILKIVSGAGIQAGIRGIISKIME